MDESEIQLGDLYRDTISGFEGIAVSRHEYIHGCTRITLQARAKDGDVKDFHVDAPALEHVPSGELVGSARTGGPRTTPPPRPTG